MDSVDLAGFLGVVLLAHPIPGPDFLVITRAAVRRPGLGRAAAMGARAGLCAHMLAAVLGLSVVAARSSAAFTAIKPAGAVHLVFLGVRALVTVRRGAAERDRRAAVEHHAPRAAEGADAGGEGLAEAVREAPRTAVRGSGRHRTRARRFPRSAIGSVTRGSMHGALDLHSV
ncbi:LysE family transporter [Streptomyces verrucosisporus]|uniref:LysE family transporter n=1 Tax=Streptomyces verrucosisporus TaxID=1695161 RepID=UPI001F126CCB|nr:LysE family transporter [Streptomyces verrucosisporus]